MPPVKTENELCYGLFVFVFLVNCLRRFTCLLSSICEYVVLTCCLCMQVQPAVKDAASRAEPAAKDVTQNYIRPAGDYVADNAVPLTQEIGARTRLMPAPLNHAN